MQVGQLESAAGFASVVTGVRGPELRPAIPCAAPAEAAVTERGVLHVEFFEFVVVQRDCRLGPVGNGALFLIPVAFVATARDMSAPEEPDREDQLTDEAEHADGDR